MNMPKRHFRPRINSADGISGGIYTPGIPLRGARWRKPPPVFLGLIRNPPPVIPGLTRNPDGDSAQRPDSGIRRIDGISHDFFVQVAPSGVGVLYQSKLPSAMPPLDGFLTPDGGFHCFVRFVPDQSVDAIFLGEAFHKVVLVLPNALNNIRSHADIEGAVSATRQDINAWLLHIRSVLDSGVRRNDSPVIPGLPRNPGAPSSRRMDSGFCSDGQLWNGEVLACGCSPVPWFEIAYCDTKHDITVCDLKFSEARQ